MRFSIAIPAYKPEFFKEAIESVASQTWQDWELVIVDDCSPADLRSIASPFLADKRIRYYRNETNIGALNVVDNWNRCLDYCKGDYVICMGDDDRLLPDCLSDLASLIDRHPGLGVYYIHSVIINARGEIIEEIAPRPETESALDTLDRRWKKNSRQFIGNLCFDLKRLKDAGGFYFLPLAWGSDDISFFIAAADGVANTQRPGFQYRQSEVTLSSDPDFEVKVKSMVRASDWYSNALADYQPFSENEREQLDRLRKSCRSHFAYLCGEYIKTDIGNHPRHVFFWLSRRVETGLPASTIILQAFKGVTLKAIGRL